MQSHLEEGFLTSIPHHLRIPLNVNYFELTKTRALRSCDQIVTPLTVAANSLTANHNEHFLRICKSLLI
ncbi:hypothetical protein PWG68_20065, partial [Chromobacterium amazonense]